MRARERLTCGVGSVFNDLFRQLIFSFQILFFMNVVQLSASQAGLVVLIGNIADATISPLTGYLGDRVNSAGHRQFCLYDDVIKMASWHNSREFIRAPKFCPSIFVYGFLVPRVPVPLKEGQPSFHSKQSAMASLAMCRRILYSKSNCGT